MASYRRLQTVAHQIFPRSYSTEIDRLDAKDAVPYAGPFCESVSDAYEKVVLDVVHPTAEPPVFMVKSQERNFTAGKGIALEYQKLVMDNERLFLLSSGTCRLVLTVRSLDKITEVPKLSYAHGTAFRVSPDYWLTNRHNVVFDARSPEQRLLHPDDPCWQMFEDWWGWTADEFPAKQFTDPTSVLNKKAIRFSLVEYSPDADVALLKAEGPVSSSIAIALPDASVPQCGDALAIIGSPGAISKAYYITQQQSALHKGVLTKNMLSYKAAMAAFRYGNARCASIGRVGNLSAYVPLERPPTFEHTASTLAGHSGSLVTVDFKSADEKRPVALYCGIHKGAYKYAEHPQNLFLPVFHPAVQKFYRNYIHSNTQDPAAIAQIDAYLAAASRWVPQQLPVQHDSSALPTMHDHVKAT
eukprot:TRINITY_DN6718_c0_g1_i5.p1 TRINITY_DN6718_c0_g1~~TRINITY_DN6718_c0_g1_i5.p1  ORF type:complete len:414 (-),score=54.04 TRINITY_DN6718_c0_g1_i5:545-1786(-)